jgi:hypothetical protein
LKADELAKRYSLEYINSHSDIKEKQISIPKTKGTKNE